MWEDDMLVGEGLVDLVEDTGRTYEYKFLFELKSKMRLATISFDIGEECHDKKTLFFRGTIDSKGVLGDDLADFLLNNDYLDYKVGFIIEEDGQKTHVLLRRTGDLIINKGDEVVYLECGVDYR